jgi:hypothetical protein
MNWELETMWKEADVVCFNVLSSHSPGGAEENHEQPQDNLLFRARFEPGTSRMRYRLSQLAQYDAV